MIFNALVIFDIEDTKERNCLWDQGVDLDDYDVMIMLDEPDKILIEEEYEETEYAYAGEPSKTVKKKRWVTNDDYYLLDRLLNGGYKNEWYKAEFRGQMRAIGIAYHG